MKYWPLLLLFAICSNDIQAVPEMGDWMQADTTEKDSGKVELPFPFKDNDEGVPGERGNIYLKDPSNVQGEFVYDPDSDSYVYEQKVGELNYRNPTHMTLEEYSNYQMKKSGRDFFRDKAKEDDVDGGESFRPKLYVENKAFDLIFGGNTIDIRPQGSAELTFGVNTTTRENPAIPENQRRTTNFDFDEKIQLNVVGSIGDKLKISTSYNTEATFDFENQTKIEYTGYEDEIIQKIELGNVALPLNGSLIQGSQTLFGIKTELKFGRMRITSVFSQEKGERKEVNVAGGAQTSIFELSAADYEEYQHYFLGHYFRDRYNDALSDLPNVLTAFRITKVEVWETQRGGNIQNARNVIAFTDLGESLRQNMSPNLTSAIQPTGRPIADNFQSNNLYLLLTDTSAQNTVLSVSEVRAIRSFTGAREVLESRLGLEQATDFETFEGVLMNQSEYSVNFDLGYISLNKKMEQQDILGVSYEYIIGDQAYRVGEMSNNVGENQQAIYVKLLKSTIINTDIPMWDLMMKNVYYLNSFGISSDDFRFEIWYLDNDQGVELPFIAEGPIDGELLLQVMELDNLDPYNAKHEDGEFDYIEGVTIRADKGRVYFPVVEPFGTHLREKLGNQDLGDKYAFDSLYSTTQALAELDANKNRFTIKGSYKSSSSSEIRLNAFNIPQGSVVVTAGGVKLVENVDYTVDYNLGTVKILNQGLLESNTPIKVSLESNSLFNIQTRTLMGTRIDYDFSENLKAGGTVLNLTERPLTNKVNIGDEAINNTIVGVDASYSTEAPILTKIADALPLFDTKEKSKVNATGEFAYLFPGNARAITKDGVAYIDDFEGSQSQIDMKSIFNWRLASTPQGQANNFPEADNTQNTLDYGYNRALLSWYIIDPLFFNANDARLPASITPEVQQNHYQREVLQQEIFPQKSLDQTLIGNIPVLDVTYYPEERGPYNFDPPNGSQFSRGLSSDGKLNDPRSRWGGMMRDLQTTDFEESNIEFIQMWVMDPFIEEDYKEIFDNDMPDGGFLYFNLGEMSEDILKDDRKSYENGYPYPGNDQPIDTSLWGVVPVNKAIVNAFDNLPSARPFQDVGFDGLINSEESLFYSDYMDQLRPALTPEAYELIANDPSGDNFRYFRDDGDSRNENVIERYAKYNGVDGNSPVSTGAFVASSTTLPDIEDINRDNTTNSKELYYQYKIPINPSVFDPDNIGNNYVTDVRETEVNGKPVAWYQFKIPIRNPDEVIGDMRDFKSIRFMRMYMKGFDQPVILRIAKLDLIRGEWRRYFGEIRDDGEYIQNEPDNTEFEVNAVNIEENSSRLPIHYVLPPGIEREIDYGTSNLQQLNEQALSLYVCGLNDGATRVAYRNMDLDIRMYKRLKMYAHVEDADQDKNAVDPLEYGDVSLIIRMGADFDNNYYEYEKPLQPSEYFNHSREAVWPSRNNIDIELSKFTDVKLSRDASNFSKTAVYSQSDGAATIRVKGSPNIATVKVMMVGVKNPKKTEDRPDDDGSSQCVIAWVNELRVSDFDNEGGWATTGAITANLADLATMKLGANMSTPGFGSLNEKLNERQQETKQAYDFSTNVELGKFTNNFLSIPMYYRYAESWDKPRFVPLNPDIELEDVENSGQFTQAQKDSILRSAIKYQHNRSLNFTNVKVNPRPGKTKSNIYDIQNFSFTYAYNLDKYRDVNIDYQNKTNHRGKILWAYNAKPKNYKPFDRSKWTKSPWMRLVKDFNFYLYPKLYQFSTSVDRDYNEKKLRQTNPFYNPRPYYQKKFDWDRDYRLSHDFARSLKFNYSSTNNGFIEETPGVVDRADTGYSNWRNTVLESFQSGGTNLRFQQNFTVDYSIPINKIPITDWVSLSTSYGGGYNWNRAAIGSESFGNTIQNNSALRYNSSLNLNNLYRKNDYLKRLAASERGRNKGKIRKSKKKEKEDKEKARQDKLQQAKGGDAGPQDDKKKDKKKKDEDKYRKLNALDYTIRVLTGIKEISGSYNQSTGTVVPGYSPTTSMLGFDQSWEAPGVPFVLGQKMDTNYVLQANDNGWLVQRELGEPELRYTFQNNEGEQYSYRINIRPINNMRIELNGNYSYNIGTNMGYTWQDSILVNDISTPYNNYVFDQAIQTGNFSVSTLTYKTAFVEDDRTSYNSSTFDKFNQFRPEASRKLAAQRALEDPNYDPVKNTETGYYDEYGATQQEVLISSFLAAYSGDDEVDIDVLEFKQLIPLPNWRVTYDGLGKIKIMKKWFSSITLNHAYRSTYNIGNFTTNNLVLAPVVDTAGGGNPDTSLLPRGTDVATGNYIPQYQISVVSITEMFSPFFDIDFNFKNGLLVGFEYKRDRNISMSTINNQISETKGEEYIVSLGYTFRDVVISFTKNSKAQPKDIVTRLDISNRDNYTILRNIGSEVNSQPGSGQNVLSIKFTADLAVSPKFNIRGFYDRIQTNPFISNSFPTTTSNYGISLRFSLAQ